MTEIMVTGATGFIGRRLVQHLLSEGHGVAVLTRRDRSASPFGPDVRVLRGDVSVPHTLGGQLSGCDLVIHLAGCTIARSRSDFDRVNHQGTLNVARACARQETPPSMLFVSSLAAAGPAVSGRPLTERDPPAPVSDYGRSKLAAEADLLRMADQLPIQVVRPPSVFGDSDRYMLPLFQLAKAGFVLLAGTAAPRYSFIHVDDLVRALLYVATCEHVRLRAPCEGGDHADQRDFPNPGLVYLAQDPPMSFAEVAAVVQHAVGGGKLRSIHVPSSICWSLAAVNSLTAKLLGLRPLVNIDKMREAMAGAWICDPHRLVGDLGFEFRESLEERLRETAISYQRKGWRA